MGASACSYRDAAPELGYCHDAVIPGATPAVDTPHWHPLQLSAILSPPGAAFYCCATGSRSGGQLGIYAGLLAEEKSHLAWLESE